MSRFGLSVCLVAATLVAFAWVSKSVEAAQMGYDATRDMGAIPLNTIPMLVGGDTSMLYPGVKGVAQTLGAESFGLVHSVPACSLTRS